MTLGWRGDFKLLGVVFNCLLEMDDAMVVIAAGWKMRTLLHTRIFYCDADLITNLVHKSRLSYVEYRPPAVYHAKRNVLNR